MAEALKGSLAQVGLLDILRMLSAGGRTGRLQLTNGSHAGEVYLNNGSVVHATSGTQVGEAAIYGMLGWLHGEFAFATEMAAPEKSVKMITAKLLDEATERAKEWNEIKHAIPSTDLVFRLSPSSSSAISLKPDDWPVLAQMNGTRTVNEIASALNRDVFDVVRTMYDLVKSGLVVSQEKTDRSGPATVGPEFFARLESEFVEFVGPLGPVIIDSEIEALGESKNAFPEEKAPHLVEQLCKEIGKEDQVIRFQTAMLKVLKKA